MVLQFIPKENQQEVLRPLAKEFRRLIKLRFGTNSEAARVLGWPSSTEVQRLTGQGTQGMDYIKATQIMVACGLTPNEGAALIGLYDEHKNSETLTTEERVLVDLYRNLTNQERKDMLLLTNQVMVESWNKQDEESEKTQEEERLLRIGPSRPLKNKRKVREASREE